MSNRLQVLISPELDAQLQKAASRERLSKGEFVRRTLLQQLETKWRSDSDPVAKLASLNGPTCDIEQMLAEIEVGRS